MTDERLDEIERHFGDAYLPWTASEHMAELIAEVRRLRVEVEHFSGLAARLEDEMVDRVRERSLMD